MNYTNPIYKRLATKYKPHGTTDKIKSLFTEWLYSVGELKEFHDEILKMIERIDFDLSDWYWKESSEREREGDEFFECMHDIKDELQSFADFLAFAWANHHKENPDGENAA